ncbi:MAG: hypothetical protein ACRDXC_13870 [Acidimicrobiales bacterium]
MRRFPLAVLLVGVMSLLAAGGAVLGAFQAPTGVDLAVHNAAGETLLADRVVGAYTTTQLAGTVISFDYTAPDHLSVEAVGTSGKVEERQKVTGAKATSVLAPLQDVLSLEGFTPRGSYYDHTKTARRPASSSQVALSETAHTQVQLAGGYVVAILRSIDVKEGSHHLTETADFRLLRVDGWSRSS